MQTPTPQDTADPSPGHSESARPSAAGALSHVSHVITSQNGYWTSEGQSVLDHTQQQTNKRSARCRGRRPRRGHLEPPAGPPGLTATAA